VENPGVAYMTQGLNTSSDSEESSSKTCGLKQPATQPKVCDCRMTSQGILPHDKLHIPQMTMTANLQQRKTPKKAFIPTSLFKCL
jgi:hypothetical protein